MTRFRLAVISLAVVIVMICIYLAIIGGIGAVIYIIGTSMGLSKETTVTVIIVAFLVTLLVQRRKK